MTSPALPLDPEALLADSTWLRALSRGLVDDHFAADDLAQEAWLAALRTGGGREGTPGLAQRTWLTGVLRNVAWKQRRTDARRRAREVRGARDEKLPSTGELVARAEMQRALSDAVVALDEPFRTTILLRYLEDLTSAEIAARQRVPEGTVRWRVKRGLEMLRGELEGRRGNEWLHSCALVAGLVRVPEAAVVTAAGASAGMLTIKASVLAASLTLAGGGAALGTGWIEAPWDPPENRMASGGGAPVHPSTESSLPTSEDDSTSEIVDAGNDARATRVRTPLAVRTPGEPSGDAEPASGERAMGSSFGLRREVRIDLRADDLEGFEAGLPEGAEEAVFFCVASADGTVPPVLDGLGLDGLELDAEALECELTDEDREQILAGLRGTLGRISLAGGLATAHWEPSAGDFVRLLRSSGAPDSADPGAKPMRVFKLHGSALRVSASGAPPASIVPQ